MRLTGSFLASALILTACGGRQPEATAERNEAELSAGAPSAAPAKAATAPRWDLRSDGSGVALALLSVEGRATIRLYCPAGGNALQVNLPGFRPVGSEERLSFGGGGEAVALVADPAGDRKLGGVSGTGAVPAGLAALLAGPVSASYGSQKSGPHPAPPVALTRAFASACGEAAPAPAASSASPCRLQDGKPLDAPAVRAVGTEPFWGARTDGRCVTYSNPEDQQGTRIWTRFVAAAGGGTWSGALDGQRFELVVRRQPGCSDGMSDRRYPMAVELTVRGERLQGCAEPL